MLQTEIVHTGLNLAVEKVIPGQSVVAGVRLARDQGCLRCPLPRLRNLAKFGSAVNLSLKDINLGGRSKSALPLLLTDESEPSPPGRFVQPKCHLSA